jgi:hypothetical protein
MTAARRLAAILVADVGGYSRLMGWPPYQRYHPQDARHHLDEARREIARDRDSIRRWVHSGPGL